MLFKISAFRDSRILFFTRIRRNVTKLAWTAVKSLLNLAILILGHIRRFLHRTDLEPQKSIFKLIGKSRFRAYLSLSRDVTRVCVRVCVVHPQAVVAEDRVESPFLDSIYLSL